MATRTTKRNMDARNPESISEGIFKRLPGSLERLQACIDDDDMDTLCHFLGRAHDALLAIEAEAASASTLAQASKAKADIELVLIACNGFPRAVRHG